MSDVDDYLERALALMRQSLAAEAQNKLAASAPATTPDTKATTAISRVEILS